jgi:hypothetical protein
VSVCLVAGLYECMCALLTVLVSCVVFVSVFESLYGSFSFV